MRHRFLLSLLAVATTTLGSLPVCPSPSHVPHFVAFRSEAQELPCPTAYIQVDYIAHSDDTIIYSSRLSYPREKRQHWVRQDLEPLPPGGYEVAVTAYNCNGTLTDAYRIAYTAAHSMTAVWTIAYIHAADGGIEIALLTAVEEHDQPNAFAVAGNIATGLTVRYAGSRPRLTCRETLTGPAIEAWNGREWTTFQVLDWPQLYTPLDVNGIVVKPPARNADVQTIRSIITDDGEVVECTQNIIAATTRLVVTSIPEDRSRRLAVVDDDFVLLSQICDVAYLSLDDTVPVYRGWDCPDGVTLEEE